MTADCLLLSTSAGSLSVCIYLLLFSSSPVSSWCHHWHGVLPSCVISTCGPATLDLRNPCPRGGSSSFAQRARWCRLLISTPQHAFASAVTLAGAWGACLRLHPGVARRHHPCIRLEREREREGEEEGEGKHLCKHSREKERAPAWAQERGREEKGAPV